MGQFISSLAAFAGLLSLSLASPHKARASSIPTVDLGYEVHTAATNDTGDYYIFSNVPYAEQPVGNRRFQAPVLPTGSSSNVNNGSDTSIMCMQAYPGWIVADEAESYGVSTAVMEEILFTASGQTESCLMLDVYVPVNIFNKGSAGKAPVLVWIHGGGFTFGSKTSVGNPATLIARSQLNDTEGIIFVSLNYRLGMYGWLGGDDITANLGLYDQLIAMEWVQKYISLFGGDPNHVTVMGESAGASSILHHLTSYGGSTALPFSRAIMQSPAFQLNLNLTDGYQRTMAVATNLTGATISSVSSLATLDSDTLKAINEQVVLAAGMGFFIYGPAPDGTYVPKLPQVLLAEGKFNSNVQVMASHNSNEAASFVSTSITTTADFISALKTGYPEMSNDTITYIDNVLYPASDYSAEFYRAAQVTTDSALGGCTTRFLGVAFYNATYNYIFAYPPGYHAEDTPYTFFNGDTSTLDDGLPVNPVIAYALQDFILGFTMGGDPSLSPAGTSVTFPVYGSSATVMELTYEGLVTGMDNMANDRCVWWQEAMVKGLV